MVLELICVFVIIRITDWDIEDILKDSDNQISNLRITDISCSDIRIFASALIEKESDISVFGNHSN